MAMAHVGAGPELTAGVAMSPGAHEPQRTLSDAVHHLTGAGTAGLEASMLGTLGVRRAVSNMQPESLPNGNSRHSLEAGRK